MGAHPLRHEERCQPRGGMCAKVCGADGSAGPRFLGEEAGYPELDVI